MQQDSGSVKPVACFTQEVGKSCRPAPLPPGEGVAKRRVRDLTSWKYNPSSGPSGHLLPEGEGHATTYRVP